ncbi:MAG: ribosome small subunit-dependent GTPase A [Desulfococcaceae bacterium]
MNTLKTGRIIAEHRQLYVIFAEGETFLGEVSGKFLFKTDRPADFPKVGDYAEYIRPKDDGRAVIQELKERKTVLSRKVPGDRTAEQVLAVNVDAVFIVMALDHDFSVRRVERYLTLTWESGARPVIVLNKSDLCEDVEAHLLKVEAVAFGVPVCVTSAVTETGMDCLQAQIRKEETICLLGSSGVGKSSLINRLLGEERQRTREIRTADSKGRHTTTHRELFTLPSGAFLIDTPGLREVQLWSAEEGLAAGFTEIETLASDCRFADCTHSVETGCAVLQALETGQLAQDRYESYQKLRREQHWLQQKQDTAGRINRKRRFKEISKAVRKMYKDRP